MDVRMLSDLHLDLLWEEGSDYVPSSVDCDVVVLAGDIAYGRSGIEWAQNRFSSQLVVYVVGNHDLYFGRVPGTVEEIRAAAAGTNVHVLENDKLVVDGVTILGTTLWTDFLLFGKPYRNTCTARAASGIRDFSGIIRFGVPPGAGKFMPHHSIIMHDQAMAWLKSEVDKTDGDVVVVTHHAPAKRSVAEQYRSDTLSAAFASAHDQLVSESGIRLWVHGHTHAALDYVLGDTRVVCNPRGYSFENTSYDPNLVISI